MIIATIILDLEWISGHQAEGRVSPKDSGGKELGVGTGKSGMGRHTRLLGFSPGLGGSSV